MTFHRFGSGLWSLDSGLSWSASVALACSSAAAAGPAGRKKGPPLIARWLEFRRLVDPSLFGQSFCRSLASLALFSGAIHGTRGINAVPSMARYWGFLLLHVLPVHLVAQCPARFRRRGSLHLPATSFRRRLKLAASYRTANCSRGPKEPLGFRRDGCARMARNVVCCGGGQGAAS